MSMIFNHRITLIALGMFFASLSVAWSQTPTFTQTVVFGDSLSDDGNVRHLMEDQYLVSYPGGDFNYSDGTSNSRAISSA